MDNRRRPLEDYFNAARREEGISEREIRSIVERGPATERGAASTGAIGKIGAWIGIGVVAIVAVIFMMRQPTPGADPVRVIAPGRVSPATSGPSVAATTDPSSAAPNGASAASSASPATGPATLTEHINQRHTDIRENETMIMYPRMKGLLLGVAIASTAAASTHAQEMAAQSTPADSSPLVKGLEREIAPMVVDYWEAKLNAYRSTIDGFLSPADLAELNRLRVQWGISLAKGDEDQQGGATMRSGIHLDTAAGKSRMSISVMGKPPAEAEQYMREHPEATLEFLGASQRAHDIAERNRAQFDRLGERVTEDAIGFIGVMKERILKFATDHRAELEKSDDGRAFLDGVKQADEKMSHITSSEGRQTIAMVYHMAVEPLVMLYDGAGVKDFFQQAGPMASVMPGWALAERSALRSCAPNPASTSATVTYQLAEPSRKTFLKLFDARGEEVGSYDLGERRSGEGSVVVDVAGLAPGTYLYRLTAATSSGEQVFSKTMQVVR